MKKGLLVIFILITSVLQAQEQNVFELFYKKIDSLHPQLNIYSSYWILSKNRNTDKDSNVINVLITYKNDTSFIIRKSILEKILDIGFSNKDTVVRQLAVNKVLEMYWLIASQPDNSFFSRRSDFNLKAKQQIVGLLTRPKTQEEIDIYIYDIKNKYASYPPPPFDWEAKRIAEKEGGDFNRVLDSLNQQFNNSWIQASTKEFETMKSRELFMAIGWLDMKEQIPWLESLLQDLVIIKNSFYKQGIKASLVRMGLDKYYDSDVKNGFYISSWYLRNQEAFIEEIKHLYSDEKVPFFSSPDSEEYLDALSAISVMERYLSNFPEKYWIEPDFTKWQDNNPLDSKPKNYLNEVRKWAKKHEGKYKFKPDCPMW